MGDGQRGREARRPQTNREKREMMGMVERGEGSSTKCGGRQLHWSCDPTLTSVDLSV